MTLLSARTEEDLLRANADDQLENMCQRWSHRLDSRFLQILHDEQRLAVEEHPCSIGFVCARVTRLTAEVLYA